MTRLSSIILRVALIIAVAISFVLTYLIMAHNTAFNRPQDVVNDNANAVQNSTVQSPTYQKFVKIFQTEATRKYINDNFQVTLIPGF